jgi:diaminohydroxyphosphoribosylaminopyrimidine deaminase/5-amino-6-(5-phosphoribosylamino)uracil reductase
MALRDAAARGLSTVGATAYVTLEPCAHQGRTGPCSDALLAAGIRKVVASLQDPNPLVAGQGFQKLRVVGIEVEVGAGAEAARELNLGFLSRMERKIPWVRMKVAASLDGQTALNNGESQWITSALARADGHAWRARAGAILTGVGTILQDNPRLDARLVECSRQPRLAIVDSRLQTPPEALLFAAARAVCIYTAVQNSSKIEALRARGATIIHCPAQQADDHMAVDLNAVLLDLARREVNELHVEAGSTLNGALLQSGLVDEVLLYIGPKWLGPGRSMARLAALENLGAAISLDFHSVERIGDDVRILARIKGRTPSTALA